MEAFLTQQSYIRKVSERFKMLESISVSTPLGNHFKLSSRDSPTDKDGKEQMEKFPCASAQGILMCKVGKGQM